MRKFINFISNIGVSKQNEDWLNNRIILTNQFGLLVLFLLASSFWISYSFEDYFAIGAILFSILVCIALFVVQFFKFPTLVTIFGILYVIIFLFYFDSYTNFECANFMYQFPLVLSIATVFNVKKEWKIIALLYTIILVLFFVNLFTDFKLFFQFNLTPKDIQIVFWRNVVSCLIAQIYFAYLIFRKAKHEQNILTLRLEEKEKTEIILQNLALEKNILVAELHHRVKNNLAIISSLFSLKINSDIHSEAKNILIESKNRVRSMALIHNRLYKNDRLSEIDFSDYGNDLILEIQNSYTNQNYVSIIKDLKPSLLDVNLAIPCGLILNEIVTNCYKHAFVTDQKGQIEIFCSIENETFTLVIQDNGVGLDEAKMKNEISEMGGISLIDGLCEQLDASFSFQLQNGTRFEMNFNTKVKLSGYSEV